MRLSTTIFFLLLILTFADLGEAAENRPNVLWIYVEDMCPWLDCYDDTLARTPAIDRLADGGSRFAHCYMPAPVCSPCRSAIITGCMQTTLGSHQHRSSRSSDAPIHLPAGVRTIPEIFRATGYYTFNQGKTDYNFVFAEEDLFDNQNRRMFNAREMNPSKFWKPALAAGKPFFGQIQLRGGKNTGKIARRTDPASVDVMPYYPDIPLVRKEIAHHYDCIQQTDQEVAIILRSLKRDDLLDNTVLFFFSDHGFRMHRHKQFCYEGGLRVPLIVSGPGVSRGQVREDLLSGIDIGATSLALAGIEIPSYMEARNVFAADYVPRKHVISARDRCDYTIDRIRAVATNRWRYIRNFLTDRPYMQPQYRDPWPMTKELRRMAKHGELNEVQLQFFGPDRPDEELYDLRNDPHEIHNLAGDSHHAQKLKQMRGILGKWIDETDDKGQYPESDASLRTVLKRWKNKCVNPEYDGVR